MYRSCPIEPGSDRQSSPQCCELPQALPRRPVYELRAKDGSARILRRTGRVLVRPGTVREIVPAGRPKASCSVRRLATKGSVELDVVDVIVPRSVHRAIIKHDRSCDVKEDHVDWPREVHLEWPRLRLAIPVEDECLGVPCVRVRGRRTGDIRRVWRRPRSTRRHGYPVTVGDLASENVHTCSWHDMNLRRAREWQVTDAPALGTTMRACSGGTNAADR